MKKRIKLIAKYFILSFFLSSQSFAAEKQILLTQEWSFKSFFGKFDRASLQRGYQVYAEVCASCHSMKYLSYRNLSESFAVLVNISPSLLGPSVNSKFEAIAFACSSENSGPPFSERFL